MLKSAIHVLSVHVFIYLVVYQSKYLYPPIARLSDSVNQDRALRPRHPGKGLQATASSPNLQGSLQVRTCKSEPSGQGLPATVPRPGPPGQGLQARASMPWGTGPRPRMKRSRPTHPLREIEMCSLSGQFRFTPSKFQSQTAYRPGPPGQGLKAMRDRAKTSYEEVQAHTPSQRNGNVLIVRPV